MTYKCNENINPWKYYNIMNYPQNWRVKDSPYRFPIMRPSNQQSKPNRFVLTYQSIACFYYINQRSQAGPLWFRVTIFSLRHSNFIGIFLKQSIVEEVTEEPINFRLVTVIRFALLNSHYHNYQLRFRG